MFSCLYILCFSATRHITLLHPRPVLLKAPLLLPVRASTSLLLTQGLNSCLNLCLSIQHPLLLALHLHLLLQSPIVSHIKNLLPSLPIMATTMWPYPLCQIAPKAPVGPLQLLRRLAEVGMKQRIYHRAVVHQQGLKGVQMVRSYTSPSPVQEAMKDNLPETGRETDYTLTGAETGRETTGTGVRSVKVMVNVIGTDGITEITSVLARTEIALLTVVPTGTGTLNSTVNGLCTMPGSVTVTGTATIIATGQERTGAVSAGDMDIPTGTGPQDRKSVV